MVTEGGVRGESRVESVCAERSAAEQGLGPEASGRKPQAGRACRAGHWGGLGAAGYGGRWWQREEAAVEQSGSRFAATCERYCGLSVAITEAGAAREAWRGGGKRVSQSEEVGEIGKDQPHLPAGEGKPELAASRRRAVSSCQGLRGPGGNS